MKPDQVHVTGRRAVETPRPLPGFGEGLSALAGAGKPALDPRRAFYTLAGQAVRAGLITPAEVALLARQGTRKAGYWARHLADLRVVLALRGMSAEMSTSRPDISSAGGGR